MPTTIYTKQPIGSVTHAGVSYEVKNGEVSVPDDAVAVLTEAHGFTTTPHSESEAEEEVTFDLSAQTKNQLIEIGVSLGAELKQSMTKDEIFAIVKPLWEAKQAA